MNPSPFNVALPSGATVPDRIDFTSHYAAVIDYIHMHMSFTGGIINDPRHILKNSMWMNDRTVGIYLTNSVPPGQYDPDAEKAFGRRIQLKAELQTFTVEETETWNVSSDYMYNSSVRNVLHPVKFMMQQIREQIIPNRDNMVFAEMRAFGNSNSLVNGTAWDKTESIYKQILEDAEHMFSTLKVDPRNGGYLLMSPAAWTAAKLDSSFKLDTDVAMRDINYHGDIGMLDGMRVKRVDDDRWASDTAWMIVMPYAVTQPFKANRNRVFYNHPDFLGWLSQHFAWLDVFITKNQGMAFYIRKDS